MIKNNKYTYGAISKFFHWIIALFILSLITVGFIMTSMENSPDKWQLYGLHKAFGVIVFSLIVLRIFWSLINVSPKLPANTSFIIVILSRLAHFLLYISMILMPFSGIAMSRFGGYPINVFDLFIIPADSKNQTLATLFHDIHGITAWTIVVLVSLHALAALYHHFVIRDNVFLRMIK
jgi:cytochrome b561